MGVIQCAWNGGPLDIYRKACLASHVAHGCSVELVSSDPIPEPPAGVKAQPDPAHRHDWMLEKALSRCAPVDDDQTRWSDLDMLRLRSDEDISTDVVSPDDDSLAWIEAFKLWLPEYAQEMHERSRTWHQVPLHLSFAAMAGIDLQCLPPLGSFLADLLARPEATTETLPKPRHDAREVRQTIQRYFHSHRSWSRDMLAQRCDVDVIKTLGLATWRMRAKQKLRRCRALIQWQG